jgi:hypothetical protein
VVDAACPAASYDASDILVKIVYYAIMILAIGVISALDIAQNVVDVILYAPLAALVGIAIVAVGGGGIKTMSQRREAVAARYNEESRASPRPSPTRPAWPTRPARPCPTMPAAPTAGPPRPEPSRSSTPTSGQTTATRAFEPSGRNLTG